jgi:hypothetical protein
MLPWVSAGGSTWGVEDYRSWDRLFSWGSRRVKRTRNFDMAVSRLFGAWGDPSLGNLWRRAALPGIPWTSGELVYLQIHLDRPQKDPQEDTILGIRWGIPLGGLFAARGPRVPSGFPGWHGGIPRSSLVTRARGGGGTSLTMEILPRHQPRIWVPAESWSIFN